MKFLRSKVTAHKNPQECLDNIKRHITVKIGVTNFIHLGENKVAFSGTADHFDLCLSLDIVKKHGKEYLYAYTEDHSEWYEWDYGSQKEFEDTIAEYFCQYINRTVKTITETKKHKYIRVTEFYLDEEINEWILLSDNKVSMMLLRPFIEADNVTEEIREYRL